MIELLTSIASYVGKSGLGVVGQTIFATRLPEQPFNCIGITLTGGPMAPGNYVAKRTFQILYRNVDPQDAATTANSIFGLFNDKWCVLSPAFHGRMTANHRPGPNWIDQNGHTIYTTNFTFTSDK